MIQSSWETCSKTSCVAGVSPGILLLAGITGDIVIGVIDIEYLDGEDITGLFFEIFFGVETDLHGVLLFVACRKINTELIIS